MKNTLQLTIGLIKQKIQEILDKKSIIKQSYDDNDNLGDYTKNTEYIVLENAQENLLNDLQKYLYNLHIESATVNLSSETNGDGAIGNNNGNSEHQEYINNDCKEIPGMLFLHDSVIKKYGRCPHINITSSNKDEVIEKRKEWLNSQRDNGQVYYDLYNTLINQSDIKSYTLQKESTENDIDNIINVTLNTVQKQVYNDALILLYEYNASKLKSKKIKEKYKEIIYLFSKLYNDTHIHIHEYVSHKLDTQIIINYNDNSGSVNKTLSIYNDLLTKNFKEYLDKYILIKQNLTNSLKYLKNTTKHLNNELVSFLKTKETDTFVQQGKFFKKWSLLTFEEQCDRFHSFARYYISRKKPLQEFKEENIEKLSNFLKESFKNKLLKYNSIKWNIKSGMIDSVLIEHIDGDFKIKTKPSVIKKAVESVSIFSKENEQNINEYILTFLIKNKKENDIIDAKFQDLCFEKIKLQLNLKKISKSDKILLKQKYTDIYEIIVKNKNAI